MANNTKKVQRCYIRRSIQKEISEIDCAYDGIDWAYLGFDQRERR